MKTATLTVTAANPVLIAGYIDRIHQQLSEGFTSGQSPDGAVYWDVSETEQ